MDATSDSGPNSLVGLAWTLSAADLRQAGNTLLRSCEKRMDSLLARPEIPDVAGFLTPLDRILLEVTNAGAHGGFLFNVHPDPDVRSAGRELSEDADRFSNAYH